MTFKSRFAAVVVLSALVGPNQLGLANDEGSGDIIAATTGAPAPQPGGPGSGDLVVASSAQDAATRAELRKTLDQDAELLFRVTDESNDSDVVAADSYETPGTDAAERQAPGRRHRHRLHSRSERSSSHSERSEKSETKADGKVDNKSAAKPDTKTDNSERPAKSEPHVEKRKLGTHELAGIGVGVFPVSGPSVMVSKPGDPRANGRVHQGVDYKANRGTPIVAAWSGKVSRAGWDPLGGWRVRIQLSNGLQVYYAHMNHPPVVKVGQHVVAGQRLGEVGETGDARGTVNHLHFEIDRPGGGILNPLNYFGTKS